MLYIKNYQNGVLETTVFPEEAKQPMTRALVLTRRMQKTSIGYEVSYHIEKPTTVLFEYKAWHD